MRPDLRNPAWWYWLVTGAALVATMAGVRGALAVTALLTVVQGVHLARRTRLGVQVRLLFLLVLFAGTWVAPLHWLQLFGTLVRLALGYCLAGRILSLLPWNRHEPLSFDFLRRTFAVRASRQAA